MLLLQILVITLFSDPVLLVLAILLWRSQPDNLVHANFKVLSSFISLEIDCFHSQ